MAVELLGALASVVAILSVVDQAVRDHNMKKASEQLSVAQALIDKHNIKLQQIQNYLDERNLNYNRALDYYQRTVRGSNMDQNRKAILSKYQQDIKQAHDKQVEENAKIADLTRAAQLEYNKQANTGILGSLKDSYVSGVTDIGNNIFNAITGGKGK